MRSLGLNVELSSLTDEDDDDGLARRRSKRAGRF
jgi:hypothetical protein